MNISIDIGTSFSSMCMKDNQGKIKPVYIKTAVNMFGNDYAIPTAVCVDKNGDMQLGQAAMNIQQQFPQNFVSEFKRNLGEETPFFLGGESFLPEELYTKFFIYFKECAEKAGGEPVDKVFITYPASYLEHDKRKRKIIGAAKAAGLFDIVLVDEPTAAAMNYLEEGSLPHDAKNLMIYDFGGGTFDVSLIRYDHGQFDLICDPDGDPECGGIDIDRIIYEDIMREVSENYAEALKMAAENPVYLQRVQFQIQEAAVKAKHQLSSVSYVQQTISIGFETMIYELKREKFDNLIASLVAKSITACRNILQSADMKSEELSAILMVGGTSRVPLVQSMLKQFAGKVPVLTAQNMDLAVVEGALKYREKKTEQKQPEQPPEQKQSKKQPQDHPAEQPLPLWKTFYKFLCISCAERLRNEGTVEILNSTSEKHICDYCNEKRFGFTVKTNRNSTASQSKPKTDPKEFVIEKGVLKQYKGNSTNVVIPDSVREIAQESFKGRRMVQTITIGEAVERIADNILGINRNGDSDTDYALREINVHNRNKAYRSKNGVLFSADSKELILYPPGNKHPSYSIPNSVRKLNSFAFAANRWLSSVNIPASVNSIGSRAFSDCLGLKKVSIANGVNEIGNFAFYRCRSLAAIELPASVKTISTCAFAGCESLEKVTLREGLQEIRPFCFRDCIKLKSIVIPKSVQNIGKEALGYYSNGKTSHRDASFLIKGYRYITLSDWKRRTAAEQYAADNHMKFEELDAFASNPSQSYGSWADNVMMSDEIKECNENTPIFGTTIARGRIAEVTFVNSLSNLPRTTYDISEQRNRSVLAWTENLGADKLRLVIGANGGVNCKNCAWLFDSYINVREIHFNGCFHGEDAVNIAGLFYHCKSLKQVDLSSARFPRVSNCTGMFEGCESLTGVDLYCLEGAPLTYTRCMFRECKAIKALDLHMLDTSRVVDMQSMFDNCRSLTRLNIDGFNTACVTDMKFMFSECEALSAVNVSRFDTRRVTDMKAMFQACTNLKNLDLSQFDFSLVTDTSYMFKDCRKLRSIHRLRIDAPNDGDCSLMFYMCSDLDQFGDVYAKKGAENNRSFLGCYAELKPVSQMTFPERLKVFIDRCPLIVKGDGVFNESSLGNLRRWLGIPSGEAVRLAHDDTLFHSGKNGFALCDTGIYCKELSGPAYHITWFKFVHSVLKDNFFIDGKAVAYISSGGAEGTPAYYIRHGFFSDLQAYLKK